MRWVTFALALLTASSIAAVALLLVRGAWFMLGIGAVLFAAGLVAAFVSEHASVTLLAVTSRVRRAAPGGWSGRVLALIGGCVPMMAVIASVYGSAHALFHGSPPWLGVAEWLFGYWVVTGPWTLFAMRTRLAPRTLIGVHAYAGQLLFLILTLSVDRFAATNVGSLALMLVVAVPPMIVGTLVGLAGLEALPAPAATAESRRLAAPRAGS